jgi:hypothetical protein
MKILAYNYYNFSQNELPAKRSHLERLVLTTGYVPNARSNGRLRKSAAAVDRGKVYS